MKRSSAPTAASARLVEPTSVTTQSGPAPARASPTASGSTPTGAASKTTSAPATAAATSGATSSIAPQPRASSPTSGSGSNPATLAPARRRAARPIEPPISPTPRTLIRMRSARRPLRPGGVALADGLGQRLQHLDGGLPADTRVGYRLAVDQLLLGRR